MLLCKTLYGFDSLHITLVFCCLSEALYLTFLRNFVVVIISFFSFLSIFCISDVLFRIHQLWMRGIVVFICKRRVFVRYTKPLVVLFVLPHMFVRFKLRFIDERHLLEKTPFVVFSYPSFTQTAVITQRNHLFRLYQLNKSCV